jgi:hypothetical protein
MNTTPVDEGGILPPLPGKDGVHGFRAQACGLPRNDGVVRGAVLHASR